MCPGTRTIKETAPLPAIATGVGVAIGLVGATAVTRVLGALLYGVGPTGPVVLGGAAVALFVVAFAASWLPARRASRVDPASVLSAE